MFPKSSKSTQNLNHIKKRSKHKFTIQEIHNHIVFTLKDSSNLGLQISAKNGPNVISTSTLMSICNPSGPSDVFISPHANVAVG